MKITPIISNEIEIEHEGIKLKIHCTTREIIVESKSKIEYPYKYMKDSNLTSYDKVKFIPSEESE